MYNIRSPWISAYDLLSNGIKDPPTVPFGHDYDEIEHWGPGHSTKLPGPRREDVLHVRRELPCSSVRPMLKRIARRVLGHRYGDLADAVTHRRTRQLEFEVENLKRELHAQSNAFIARLTYGEGSRPSGLEAAELKIFSQNGEDGILLWLASMSGTTTGRFVEIGIGDGSECCTANLALNWGWSGIMIEASPDDARSAAARFQDLPVAVEEAFVNASNVNELIGAEAVDLLAIDIDGNDYWVWKALERPSRFTVIEYNASLGPSASVTIPYDPAFDYKTASHHRLYHGASLCALVKLAGPKGQALVGCDSQGVNAFFVDRSLLGGELAEREAADAWRPSQKRERRFSQGEQRSLLESYPWVEI